MLQLVWFKKDLRLADHAPLTEALKHGPVLPLYVYEPVVYNAKTFDPSHLIFLNQCLGELRYQLRQRGGELFLRHGELTDILTGLHKEVGIAKLWSHEETGDWASFQRDLAVKTWCETHNITWTELPQTGVVRRLNSRDGWARQWARRMHQPVLPAPEQVTVPEGVESGEIKTERDLGLTTNTTPTLQLGGELAAHSTLNSFLNERGQDYSRHMSSPGTAELSCSRVSPYLTWGCLSMKQVAHITKIHKQQLYALKEEGRSINSKWFRAIASFEKRLRWHCHFTQKLESQPSIEWEPFHSAYRNCRSDYDPALLEAWQTGQTGYPLIDACMRYVQSGGWLNFRMRALVVSFASYHLWLPWQITAPFLARHFLDYEPGIHYSQFQMQSGETGINTIRIYSPRKQVEDQDPKGNFIKRWVPELEAVPAEHIAEPHLMPPLLAAMHDFHLGKTYPAPIVDPKAAYNEAKAKIFAIRQQARHKEEADRVYQQHGSRWSGRS